MAAILSWPQCVNVEWYNELQYKQFSPKNWPTFVVHDLDISYNLSFIHVSHVNLNTDVSSLPMPLLLIAVILSEGHFMPFRMFNIIYIYS